MKKENGQEYECKTIGKIKEFKFDLREKLEVSCRQIQASGTQPQETFKQELIIQKIVGLI